MSTPFRRSLPAQPNLEQQKKQAKELLGSFAQNESEAVARVRAVLPDKQRITLADAQFVLAREYGFANWAALKEHIESQPSVDNDAEDRMRDAFNRRDAAAVRRLLQQHPSLRARINEPLFSFDAPAIVACADDADIVDVLLEFGADPNRKSDWWAGGFHALYGATPLTASKLIAAGAIVDACAAAHLDRADLLSQLIAKDPQRVHERGGDGQTPLHFATSRHIIDLLLEAGADINARDVDHRSTPAQWMLKQKRGAGRYELAEYLVQRGAEADIFLAAALGLSDVAQRMVAAQPELLELRTGQGDYAEKPPSAPHIYTWTIGDSRSPLDVAAQFEQMDTLDVMLEFASPLQRLQLACRRGDEAAARGIIQQHPGIIAGMTPADHRVIADAAWNGDARAVSLMLKLGFDPRATGHDSGTALHLAAWEGSADIVRLLLAHPHARELVHVRDAHYNATPLGWCCHGSTYGNPAHAHAQVAQLLLDAGAQVGAEIQHASPAVRAVLVER